MEKCSINILLNFSYFAWNKNHARNDTRVNKCDPLCENTAKVIFWGFAVFYKKIILYMVKNNLWKYNLYIFNIDWVSYSEIDGRNQTLILVIL